MAGNNLVELKTKLGADSVKKKFEDMLGKRAPQFMTSITSVVQNSDLLQKADVNSIIMGAATAASMDLPLNPNLGYAALVPFNSKKGCFAQLQIMTKGWTELFLRTGQCKSLINEVVYEGQLVKKNKFTGEYVFDEDAKKSNKIIGYMAYFKLTNGYEKTEYMTVEEVKAHAQRFSQTYRSGAGIWKEDFDAMSKKTVLKKLLTKWAPKSIEIQMAATFDQGVIKGNVENFEQATVDYEDMQGESKKAVKTVDVVEPTTVVDLGEGQDVQSPSVQAPPADAPVDADELPFG